MASSLNLDAQYLREAISNFREASDKNIAMT